MLEGASGGGSQPPRKMVVWTVRLVVPLICTLLALCGVELALRSLPGDPVHRGVPPRPGDLATIGLPSVEGVFQLAQPNLRARYRGALYTTNSRGVRGPEMPVEKPAGTYRIAVIGDSFTMGSGVRLEHAYPALLQAKLNRSPDGTRFEVLNFGLAGLSLERSIRARLEPIALDYDPDLLVYGFTVNDVEGERYAATWRPDRVRHASLLMEILHQRWDYLRDMVWPSPASYIRELDRNYFEGTGAWEDFEAALDRLAEIARERGVCVVVLIHTQLTALHSWHPYLRHYEAATHAARARGFHVVETFSRFRGAVSVKWWKRSDGINRSVAIG